MLFKKWYWKPKKRRWLTEDFICLSFYLVSIYVSISILLPSKTVFFFVFWESESVHNNKNITHLARRISSAFPKNKYLKILQINPKRLVLIEKTWRPTTFLWLIAIFNFITRNGNKTKTQCSISPKHFKRLRSHVRITCVNRLIKKIKWNATFYLANFERWSEGVSGVWMCTCWQPFAFQKVQVLLNRLLEVWLNILYRTDKEKYKWISFCTNFCLKWLSHTWKKRKLNLKWQIFSRLKMFFSGFKKKETQFLSN